jgi:hypothetical protein
VLQPLAQFARAPRLELLGEDADGERMEAYAVEEVDQLLALRPLQLRVRCGRQLRQLGEPLEGVGRGPAASQSIELDALVG